MKAACYEKQGPAREVLAIGDMPDPAEGSGEVRIRIAASGINPGDSLFPIAEARPEDETDTGRVVQSSRLDPSLLIEGQLLSQEQDLRAQGCARAEQETEEKSVRDQIGDR